MTFWLQKTLNIADAPMMAMGAAPVAAAAPAKEEVILLMQSFLFYQNQIFNFVFIVRAHSI